MSAALSTPMRVLYIDLKTHFYQLRSSTHQPKTWQYNLGDALANQKPEGVETH